MESSTGGMLVPMIGLAIMVFFFAAFWRVFAKAGKPGWAAIVPIYNVVVLMQIAGRPVWWVLLMFIPIVNIIVSFVVVMDIARAFGKGAGFGVGLFFLAPVFYPILGFGSADYVGAQH